MIWIVTGSELAWADLDLLKRMTVAAGIGSDKWLTRLPTNLTVGKDDMVVWADSTVQDRGTVAEIKNTYEVLTLHPSYARKHQAWFPVLVADLRRAREISENGYSPPVSVIAMPTKAENILSGMNQLTTRPDTTVALDLELSGDVLQNIGLAWKGESGHWLAFSIPFTKGDKGYWTADEEAAIIEAFGKLTRSGVKCVFHNAQYDLCWLEKHGFLVKEFAFDTMLAQHVLHPELPKDLQFLRSIHTYHPYYGDLLKSHKWQDRARKNAMDALVTVECAGVLMRELLERGLTGAYEWLCHRLVRPFCRLPQGHQIADPLYGQWWGDRQKKPVPARPLAPGKHYLILALVEEPHNRLDRFLSMDEVRDWRARVVETVNATHKHKNPYGRERLFYERKGQKRNRQAVGWVLNSTVRDYLHGVIRELWEQLPPWIGLYDFRENYCEIVLEADGDFTADVRADVEKVLAVPLTITGRELHWAWEVREVCG